MAESLIDIRKRISFHKENKSNNKRHANGICLQTDPRRTKGTGISALCGKNTRNRNTYCQHAIICFCEEHGHVSASDQVLVDFHDIC